MGIRCQVREFLHSQQVKEELVTYVRHYFKRYERKNDDTSNSSTKPTIHRFLPPLYLQHEGHSRTIIGIEEKKRLNRYSDQRSLSHFFHPSEHNNQSQQSKKRKHNATHDQYHTEVVITPEEINKHVNLLMFDPAHNGFTLKRLMSEEKGNWASMIKRGAHTLKKTAYQIVEIVEPYTIMSKEEREKSKVF